MGIAMTRTRSLLSNFLGFFAFWVVNTLFAKQAVPPLWNGEQAHVEAEGKNNY